MANKKGHWYTDKNGNHYFVEEGQTAEQGWEASKRRKMLKDGKYQVSENGNDYEEVDEKSFKDYQADEEFDETNDDDFGFDEDDIDEYGNTKEEDEYFSKLNEEAKDDLVGTKKIRDRGYRLSGDGDLGEVAKTYDISEDLEKKMDDFEEYDNNPKKDEKDYSSDKEWKQKAKELLNIWNDRRNPEIEELLKGRDVHELSPDEIEDIYDQVTKNEQHISTKGMDESTMKGIAERLGLNLQKNGDDYILKASDGDIDQLMEVLNKYWNKMND